ncbi:MAG: hypothetical protein KDD61_17340, partial [Bdellovibrionales bacterium]|nr:hypothetical protein [Bdellovibrionales bacterium]
MSRIAFLTESTPQDQNYISQTTYELIRSLKSNQHTVQVFAPFHSTDQFNYDEPFEMSFPTKGWKLWELPFLIPALHKFRPDILHVIQPHQDRFQSFFHLFKILPTLKPLMNNIPIVVSLFNW